MNVFHPDYIKTMQPEFLSTVRTESSQIAQGKINGAKSRHTRESVKSVSDIKAFPLTRSRK